MINFLLAEAAGGLRGGTRVTLLASIGLLLSFPIRSLALPAEEPGKYKEFKCRVKSIGAPSKSPAARGKSTQLGNWSIRQTFEGGAKFCLEHSGNQVHCQRTPIHSLPVAPNSPDAFFSVGSPAPVDYLGKAEPGTIFLTDGSSEKLTQLQFGNTEIYVSRAHHTGQFAVARYSKEALILALLDSAGNEIWRKELARHPMGGSRESLHITQDGKHIILATQSGSRKEDKGALRIFSSSGESVFAIPLEFPQFFLSPDEKTLAYKGISDAKDVVGAYRLGSAKKIFERKFERIRGMSLRIQDFSPDSKQLLMGRFVGGSRKTKRKRQIDRIWFVNFENLEIDVAETSIPLEGSGRLRLDKGRRIRLIDSGKEKYFEIVR